MNWKVKAHLLALLSRIPAGRNIYHKLQKVGGTNRLQLDRDLGRAFELVQLAKGAEQNLIGAEVLEIGTGWRPLVPFVFALAGTKHITTIDVNPWLTHEYALETWKALRPRLEEIAAETGEPAADVKERYRAIDQHVEQLDELLAQIGITYVYPGDARETGLPDKTVDMVISSNVLEHIPLDLQTEIHRESLRILRVSGVAIHRFNPQDHYSTVDGNITHANFLQFSAREWEWYGGSGLAYHNRLRAPDYRKMFTDVGFELTVCRERVDERSLVAIESGELKLSAEFAAYHPKELAVDYMWVVATKPDSKESLSGPPSGNSATPQQQSSTVNT